MSRKLCRIHLAESCGLSAQIGEKGWFEAAFREGGLLGIPPSFIFYKLGCGWTNPVLVGVFKKQQADFWARVANEQGVGI